MATYITLLKYTEQGLKTIKESPSRLERAKQLLKSLGGELKSFHLVQGRYDAVVISEAPNDEVVMKFALERELHHHFVVRRLRDDDRVVAALHEVERFQLAPERLQKLLGPLEPAGALLDRLEALLRVLQ